MAEEEARAAGRQAERGVYNRLQGASSSRKIDGILPARPLAPLWRRFWAWHSCAFVTAVCPIDTTASQPLTWPLAIPHRLLAAGRHHEAWRRPPLPPGHARRPGHGLHHVIGGGVMVGWAGWEGAPGPSEVGRLRCQRRRCKRPRPPCLVFDRQRGGHEHDAQGLGAAGGELAHTLSAGPGPVSRAA